VAAFAAQVAALPEVVARGGLDALVANAGRLVFGNQIPPFQDTTQYYAGLQLAVQTIYIGNLRVINSLLPLVQSAAAARPDQYGRIVVTVSPAGYANGGMDMFDFYVGPYIENKRALLAAVNTLRGGLAFQKSPVKVSTVNPFITNTTITDGLNPIYQQVGCLEVLGGVWTLVTRRVWRGTHSPPTPTPCPHPFISSPWTRPATVLTTPSSRLSSTLPATRPTTASPPR
jgi:hypothetical protein